MAVRYADARGVDTDGIPRGLVVTACARGKAGVFAWIR
jgi:hypothetical protein